MRILHLSDKLPDVRVERFIQLDSMLGHSNAFFGDISDPLQSALELPHSMKYFNIEIGRQFRWGIIKQKYFDMIEKTIIEFDPDVIHAHNIYFLNFINRFLTKTKSVTPIVYNDHEYWSKSMQIISSAFFSSLNWFRAIRTRYRSWIYQKWEKKFVHNRTVLTVSKKIAEAHEENYNPSFVSYIPNMPTLKECSAINLVERRKQKTVVYIGSDFTVKNVPCRNTGTILEEWTKQKPAKLILIGDSNIQSDDVITSLGTIPHISLYHHASMAHFGALAYLPHHFHEYISPNKIYIYIHAGALPILPKSVPFEVDVPRFSSTPEFLEILHNHSIPDANELRSIAAESLIADNYLGTLKEAYEDAFSH
ncbi:MAG: glycosyltransferase [Candidatus Thorarchaeota archaeon]